MRARTLRQPEVADLDAAVDLLTCFERPDSAGAKGPLRVEVPVRDAPDPLAWLTAQAPGTRCYWSDRDGQITIAGVGLALSTRSPEDATVALAHSDDGWRWLGGIAFDSGGPRSAEWAAHGDAHLRVPRLTLERGRDGTLLCAHLQDAPLDPALARAARRHPRATPPPTLEPLRLHAPDETGWQALVEGARAAMADGTLQKVVLARRTEVRLAREVDPFALLARLARDQPHTYGFAFELPGGGAFIGCTPELLYARQGALVQTEAVAGTRPRGRAPDEDRALARALLHSAKDAAEHRHVVEAIEAGLRATDCLIENKPAQHILALETVQHLHTPFEAVAFDARRLDTRLLRQLHPTPAVCGTPRPAAAAHIARHEPFDRGWYAGPVGWLTRDAACFAVGIRSALVQGQRLYVFAGAGLVAESDPREEWREVETKSHPFLGLA